MMYTLSPDKSHSSHIGVLIQNKLIKIILERYTNMAAMTSSTEDITRRREDMNFIFEW